jgi:transposase
MSSIPPCDECADRRAEAAVLPGDGGQDVLSHLCFDCLRRHPEFRFFKILPGARKRPEDITLRRIEEAKNLQDQGMGFPAIAERFGVTQAAVRRWLDPRVQERSLAADQRWWAGSEAAQLKRERLRAYKAEHPLYHTWIGIRSRCYTPTTENYHNYGGRGIKMHPTWENNFDAFEAWIYANLGPRPAGKTLDRYPDNDGDYAPGNVRWATKLEQRSNARSAVRNVVVDRLRDQLRAAGLDPCA